jgi:hypothetical protein
MSISINSSPQPRYMIEPIEPSEAMRVKCAENEAIYLTMDLHSIFGFRGDSKSKYSMEVSFGYKIHPIGNVVEIRMI